MILTTPPPPGIHLEESQLFTLDILKAPKQKGIGQRRFKCEIKMVHPTLLRSRAHSDTDTDRQIDRQTDTQEHTFTYRSEPVCELTYSVFTCLLFLFSHLFRMQVFHFFGWLWIMNFVIAFGQCVLAGAFVSWYFAFQKPEVSYWRCWGGCHVFILPLPLLLLFCVLFWFWCLYWGCRCCFCFCC